MTELGRIGAYRLLAELGRGGAGTVYRAVGPSGEGVALKALLAGGADGHAVARFLRESQIRIAHPNVVRTLGGGIAEDGRPYVVQELLRGTTLRAALARMTRDEIVDAVRQAAAGVGALHAAGMIHRDLKPENLFLCEDGTVKVLDLGIAAYVDQRVTLTATGTVVGTPAYLSPEQARGDRALDPRCDVWALGAVLYEGLVGRSPFARGSVLATMLAVSIDPLPPIRDAHPEVSRRLEGVVERCLDRVIERRYADGGALARALEELAHAPSAPEHVPTAASPRRARPRRSIAMLLVADASRAADFAARTRAEGAEPVLLRDGRGIALFGGTISRGDETPRALGLARALAADAGPVAIALGWAEMEGASPGGAVIEEAEAALAQSGGRGTVICGPATSRALGGIAVERDDAPGTFDVGEVARAPGISRLLGRAAELATLERARDAALSEERVVTSWIVGAAGAGKSRLADRVPTLAAEGSAPMRIRRARAGVVGPRMFSLWSLALELGPSRASLESLDASVRADQAREEILDALAREIELGPLVLLLEDVQWADPASMELLPLVVERLEGHAAWIVLTARPEALERLAMPVESAFLVQPSPLTAVDAQALAQSHGKTLALREAQALVERTGGHPLFLDALIQTHAVDEGDAAGAGRASDAPLPPSIEHAVQARLDLLPSLERDAFARLAVLGAPAKAADLRALGVEAAEPALEGLVRHGLVTRALANGIATHRVESELVADVAARTLPDDVRAGLHRAAARVVAASGRDEELVAHHLEHGGDRLAAAAAYARAVVLALHGGDARQIARCAERALACDPDGAGTLELHLARLEAARWTGEPRVEERALEAASACAATVAERARVESERGDWLRRRGRSEEAILALDRAIALAAEAALPDLLATASCRRAVLSALHGRESEALAALATARAQPPPLALTTLALIEDSSGFVAGCTGDHEKRRRAFAEAARLYARAGDLRRSAGAESNSADAANRLGDFKGAERALRRGLTAARRVGNRLTEGYALVNLGYTLHALARADEASSAIEQALRIAERAADPRLRAAATLYRCRVAPRADDEEALVVLSEDASTTVAALALALRARRALARDDLATARDASARALALRDRDGSLEEGEAEIFLVAADAMRALGEQAEADAIAARGAARIDALADRIEDPEARAAFLASAPEHQALRDAAGGAGDA